MTDNRPTALLVRSVEWYTDTLFDLRLERPDVTFQPGDCIPLYTTDGMMSRPYSLASGIHDDEWRFLIRCMAGGQVSPYLGRLRPGDQVLGGVPFGWFRPGRHHDTHPPVFIATGTGIAPFLSALRSFPERPPLHCLHGVRRRRDAVDYDWLARHCPVQLTVSREHHHDAHHGRVTDLLPKIPLSPDTHYYLCGLDAMIVEVGSWLESRGVPRTSIHCECFFNAPQTGQADR